jgi:chemotaxis protein methyltransferase CheR
MERRVRTFADRRGFADLTSYVAELRRSPDEVTAFLDRVTINVSQLWRNPSSGGCSPRTCSRARRRQRPDPHLERRLLLRRRGLHARGDRPRVRARARVEIRGTDIDKRMVERAREGRFNSDDARDAPAAEMKRWFDPEPDGGWRAKAELRAMARFEAGDLLRMRVKPAEYDLVLCRNTVIYFNEEVRDALHARLADALRPGGYLVIGATERVAQAP